MPKSGNKASSELAPATSGGAACQPRGWGGSRSRVCLLFSPATQTPPYPPPDPRSPLAELCCFSCCVSCQAEASRSCCAWLVSARERHHSHVEPTPALSLVRSSGRSALPHALPPGSWWPSKKLFSSSSPCHFPGQQGEKGKRGKSLATGSGRRDGRQRAVCRAGQESCWDRCDRALHKEPMNRKQGMGQQQSQESRWTEGRHWEQ